MAKTNKYDSRHWRNQAAYERQVDAIYRAAAKEAAALGVSIKDFNPDRLFSFSDYPNTRKKIEKLLSGLQSAIEAVIVNGIRSEWTLANNKNDELARQVFGDSIEKLSKEQERRYFSTNGAARDAFIKRKTDGLGLSDRVWKYTSQFKEEIELGLDLGIRSGRSADELSRDLRSYLQHPDKLFRRVRNEHGQLVLSQRAKAYHPGRGVYRSSYKNARRLAATETNIAYRTADYERWQQLDFVVGIEIQLSGNHPEPDICDDLKGRYPKDFKFTGWHPHCRCHVISILKTPEELMADNRRIIEGEKPTETSANTVKDVPQAFTDWVRNNGDRIRRAKSLPYFIKDNKAVVDNILGKNKVSIPKTLKELDLAIQNYAFADKSLLEHAEEVETDMKQLLDSNDLGMDVPHEYIESIIEKGFLNQFQTGTSKGYIRDHSTAGKIDEGNIRLFASHKMFNPSNQSYLSGSVYNRATKYTGQQFARGEYEKYGHLLSRDKLNYYSDKTHYGDVQVRFKRDKVNCTWTFDDSLNIMGKSSSGRYMQPTSVNAPKVHSFDKVINYDDYKHAKDYGKEHPLEITDVSAWESRMRTQYIELQFHGKLTIDDVESMTFGKNPADVLPSSVLKKLIDKGIELWYIDKEKIKVKGRRIPYSKNVLKRYTI